MTRNKIKSLALVFSSILLVSCGKNVGNQVIIENSNASESNESSSDATENTTEVTENVDEVVEEQEEGNIFSMMPKKYVFSSGVGAWRTCIEVSDDGSFVGNYTDSDMGCIGEEYQGTQYKSDFAGQFSNPEPTEKPHIYSMKLQELNIENAEKVGTEEIIDEILYVYTEPYGFDDADELLIFMPGASMEDMPEECVSWTSLNTSIYKEVPEGYFVIYNVGGKEAFCGESEDSIWMRSVRYDYGNAYAEFTPSYYMGSRLSFHDPDSGTSFKLKVPWDGKNNEAMVCEDYWKMDDDAAGTKVKVTVKPEKDSDSEKLKYVITMEHLSEPQYDFSKWGSNEPGKFSAVFTEKKDR